MRRKRDGEGELKVAPQSRSRQVAVYNTRRPKMPIHIHFSSMVAPKTTPEVMR
jgi:hypothetical protein